MQHTLIASSTINRNFSLSPLSITAHAGVVTNTLSSFRVTQISTIGGYWAKISKETPHSWIIALLTRSYLLLFQLIGVVVILFYFIFISFTFTQNFFVGGGGCKDGPYISIDLVYIYR